MLTIITLPGIWLLIATAALLQLWRGDLLGWDTILWCVGLGVFAEIVEFIASALGASKAGGSRRAAIGSMLGALIGAILAAPILFPLGSIAGGALGAGLGALLAERTMPERTWLHSGRVGVGAAIGRLIATIVKSAVSAIIAIILVIGAWR